MSVMDSVRDEYRRYKAMAERVFAQLSAAELAERPGGDGNSVATLAWHISGNLKSRFTDFLTTDGEKPWRTREAEFDPREVGRDALLREWEDGWAVLFDTLSSLDDSHLERTVSIRGRELSVIEALHRSLAHVAYHVGQMVSFGRTLKGDDWAFITIPPGGTAAYNRAPEREKPPPEDPASAAGADASGGDAGFPEPDVALTHILVVAELERARRFYVDVLGAELYREYGGTSAVLRFAGTWLLLVTGGGPTADKPTVTFAAPADPDRVSHAMTIRVRDCRAVHRALVDRGAVFLTPPVDHGSEVRAFFRDPDGHLLEISEAG